MKDVNEISVTELCDSAIDDIWDKFDEGMSEKGMYKTLSDGASAIREEWDELWEEVKKKNPDPERIKKESIDLAVTALKMVVFADMLYYEQVKK